MHAFKSTHDRQMATLKELMTIDPMTIQAYTSLIRNRIEARRLIENARIAHNYKLTEQV